MRTIIFLLLQAALILAMPSASFADDSTPPDKPLSFSIAPQNVPKDWLPQAMAKAGECTAPVDAHLDPPPHLAMIQLHLLDGTIVGADNFIVTSSGNPDFDKRVVDCFAHIPHDATSKLTGNWRFAVKVYVSNGLITLLSPPPPPPDMSSRVGVTIPGTPSGQRHSCDDMYPPTALQQHEEGTTELAFIVTATGSVRDVKITKSSGHDDLDQVAEGCVTLWQYKPATKNGVAVDAEWRSAIKWTLQIPAQGFTEYYIAAWQCAHSMPPAESELAKVTGPTEIEVTIASGRLARVITKISSGSAALDARAEACFINVPSNLVAAVDGPVVKDVPVFWGRTTP